MLGLSSACQIHMCIKLASHHKVHEPKLFPYLDILSEGIDAHFFPSSQVDKTLQVSQKLPFVVRRSPQAKWNSLGQNTS